MQIQGGVPNIMADRGYDGTWSLWKAVADSIPPSGPIMPNPESRNVSSGSVGNEEQGV